MQVHHIFSLTLACLTIYTSKSTCFVALKGWSPSLSSGFLPQLKRDPSTPQQQAGLVQNPPAPAQQPQNSTNTADPGKGTESPLEVIPNGAAAVESDDVDCNNITTGRNNECWAQLNLTKLEGFPGLDCTGIKISSCTAPQGENVLTDPRVFYVAFNIYSINQFFFSWWTAVGDAASMASDNVDEIVQLLDPTSSANADLDAILITLTGIFALAPGLGYIADEIGDISDSFVAAAQVIENALFVLPQIGRWIFPVDSESSQVVQMSALSGDMVNIIQTVQNNLNKTLVSVMANSTEFLAFASQGNFSESAPSLPDQTKYLLYAFNTYIISQALSGNNVYGVFARDTNPQALASNGSRTPYDLSECKGGYNAQGVCDNWWYSERYSSTFGLDDFSHMNREYGDTLTTLFSNYTTGQMLFEGAYACSGNGSYGQPVNMVVDAGGINTACFSQLRVVTWDMSCDDPTKRSQCEFLEMPRQNNFFGNCGSHSAYDVMEQLVYCVPASYLGPLIAQNNIQLKR